MTILEEMGLIVTVASDEKGCQLVRFALRNEPVTVLGVEFDARATTLGQTSWIEASAGHLPEAVLQLVDESHHDALKSEVLGALLAERKKNAASPSVNSGPAFEA